MERTTRCFTNLAEVSMNIISGKGLAVKDTPDKSTPGKDFPDKL